MFLIWVSRPCSCDIPSTPPCLCTCLLLSLRAVCLLYYWAHNLDYPTLTHVCPRGDLWSSFFWLILHKSSHFVTLAIAGVGAYCEPNASIVTCLVRGAGGQGPWCVRAYMCAVYAGVAVPACSVNMCDHSSLWVCYLGAIHVCAFSYHVPWHKCVCIRLSSMLWLVALFCILAYFRLA